MKKDKKMVLGLLIVIVFVLLIIGLREYVAAIFAGLIISYAFYPLFKYLNKWIKNDYASAGITIFLSIIILIIPLAILSGLFVNQSVDYINYLNENNVFSKMSTELKEQPFTVGLYDLIQDQEIRASIKGMIKNGISMIAGNIPSIVGSLSSFLIKFFVAFVVMFFALIDKGKFLNFVKNFLPFKKSNLNKLEKESKNIINTVVYGMVLVAIIQGIVGGIGFFIFGLKGPILWGFAMAIASLIPIIGAFIIWVPASIYLMASGNLYSGIGLFIYGAVIISLSDNLSRMKIFGSLGKIHPLVTLFGILIGLPYLGIIGLVIGPLTVALFMNFLKIYKEEHIE